MHFRPKPEIGIAFVAMKRNIAGSGQGAASWRTTWAPGFLGEQCAAGNAAMQAETLYTGTLSAPAYIHSATVPRLTLPKMDFNEITREALFQAFQSGYNVNYAGSSWGERQRRLQLHRERHDVRGLER